jgi:mannosyltransferase OCH1-like enzyme
MNLIPKVIHVAWKDKKVIDSDSPLIVNGLKNLIALNPDWEVKVYDDTDIDQYLKECLNPDDYELIKDKHIVEKSDLWRLIKLYHEGGMYVDIDRFCNISLSEVLNENTLCVLATCLDNDFSQDIMISCPGNRIYSTALQLSLQRRREGHTSTYFLGPQTYMHSVTWVLCGEIIDSYPDPIVFAKVRNTIESIPYIKLYREHPPHQTLIYRDDNHTLDLEKIKRDFYASSGIKHWTGEW